MCVSLRWVQSELNLADFLSRAWDGCTARQAVLEAAAKERLLVASPQWAEWGAIADCDKAVAPCRLPLSVGGGGGGGDSQKFSQGARNNCGQWTERWQTTGGPVQCKAGQGRAGQGRASATKQAVDYPCTSAPIALQPFSSL